MREDRNGHAPAATHDASPAGNDEAATVSTAWIALVLGSTLVAFLAHALVYRFQTDDAFIVFRYVENLVAGHGLVFNPGGDPVEGYTCFGWVLTLGALNRLGLDVERAAELVSLGASVGLWGVLLAFARVELPRRSWWIGATATLGFLAVTRTTAVWATGGLETRFFELAFLAGVARALYEDRILTSGGRPRPLGAIALALAAITRPEGPWLGALALGAMWVLRRRSEENSWRRAWMFSSAAILVGAVAAHFAFRVGYHGDWLPNTWYAKVDGRRNWGMGLNYLALFGLEYGFWLWPPVWVAGVLHFVRRGRGIVPWTFGAIVIPYLAYIAAVGGDHFEYRLLELVVPFLFVLAGAGVLELGRRGRASRGAASAYALLLVLGLVELPLRSRLEYPREVYVAGYPGMAGDYARGFLRPGVDGPDLGGARARSTPALLHHLPIARTFARWHRDLLDEATLGFVGIRQEEHELFHRDAETESRRLIARVESGEFAPDTHIGLDCVGTVAYRSDLVIFDRLGLTNREVAAGDFVNPDLAAHGKYATLQQGVDARVDLWSIDPLRLHWPLRHPRFLELMRHYGDQGEDVAFAEVEPDLFILAWLPLGVEHARSRFPAIEWRSTLEIDAVRDILRRAAP